MDISIIEPVSDQPDWGSRRLRLRHTVRVPARILGQKGDPITAEIRNVSSNGMFLGYDLLVPAGGIEPLSIGTTVHILFKPDAESAPDNMVTTAAEIMRRHPHGIGVQMVAMDGNQRQALRMLAVAAVLEREHNMRYSEDTATLGKAENELNNKTIIRHCRKVIERHLPNILWVLRMEVSKRLRLYKDDNDPESRALGIADADLLDEKASAIGLTIERRVMQAFAELGSLDSTQELLFNSPQSIMASTLESDEALRLMDKKAVEQSVLLQTAIQRVESKLHTKSFEINVRVAGVLMRRVDNVENPLLPSVLCRMLWQSTLEYCKTTRVQRSLQNAIALRVTPLLSDLYDDLGETLDKHGVPNAFSE